MPTKANLPVQPKPAAPKPAPPSGKTVTATALLLQGVGPKPPPSADARVGRQQEFRGDSTGGGAQQTTPDVWGGGEDKLKRKRSIGEERRESAYGVDM
eukprot:CAMPEP_0194283506 /NCGR_PEP_ID=MMETSP0169-20130528/25545_1 /TAXON_ID=218684 /ORGANISM="Corethron pennatum, Strain L29A3" /LENGTH=97 /DNA_ID=CAMNT_0039029127 /DNA_START=532 /DNA_END=827 /DNA_ORIENTATION=-